MALAGLVVEEVAVDDATVSVRALSQRFEGRCLLCGEGSRSLHSRYVRRLLNLPARRREVAVFVRIRRFQSRTGGGHRRIFSEQLARGAARLRRRATKPSTTSRVIGIDDWARRKGHLYGTIISDLERPEPINLLFDGELATVAARLSQRPSIKIIGKPSERPSLLRSWLT